jgi:hypothetical protein
MNAFVDRCMDCIDARDLKIVIPPTDRGHSSGIGGVRRGISGVVHDHPESLSALAGIRNLLVLPGLQRQRIH